MVQMLPENYLFLFFVRIFNKNKCISMSQLLVFLDIYSYTWIAYSQKVYSFLVQRLNTLFLIAFKKNIVKVFVTSIFVWTDWKDYAIEHLLSWIRQVFIYWVCIVYYLSKQSHFKSTLHFFLNKCTILTFMRFSHDQRFSILIIQVKSIG